MVHVARTDLGGSAPTGAGETMFSLVHLSDLHVLDAASPARAEWVELEADDPLWRPLLHMHRPYDTLTLHALDAHVRAIRRNPVGRVTGRPYDLAVSTGDNIDNAQRNELDAYLAIMTGGIAQLGAHGSAQDASAMHDGPWPYWSPDDSIDDGWRKRGYPAVDDFIERVSSPITSPGLGLPWTSIPGNHDLLRQGTSLPTPSLEAIAVGATKTLHRPAAFMPADPVNQFLDEPESFSTGSGFAIIADADRRAIDRNEWIDAHFSAGALGYNAPTRAPGIDTGISPGIDTVVDTERIRFVLLDTNHPDGDFDGSVGVAQLAWLDERLAEVDREPGRLAIVATHHGTDALVNDRGHRPDRRMAGAMEDVVHRHRCAVAWLVGHRHINRIDPRPGPAGGFWEITTCSIIDWPSQTRSIEVVRHRDGTIELVCSMIDHDDSPGGLASLHRDLALRFTTARTASRMAGRESDRDVRLVLPPRR